MLLWRLAILGVLGAWIGAMLFFALVVAPGAFAVLPTRELAGSVVGRALGRLDAIGLAVGALAAASAALEALLRRGAGGWLPRLALAFLALALVAGSIRLSARMQALRVEMGGVEQVAEDHPLRLAFGRLHRTSVRLHAGTLALALALFCLEARGILRPRP